MRIGLIYHQFVPRGGLEGYLLDFAARLQTAGHDLHIVTSVIAPETVKKLDAELTHVPLVKGSSLLRLWQFERQTSQMTNRSLNVDVTIGFGRTTKHDLHRAGGGCHHVYSRLLPFYKRLGPKNLLELQLERKLYTGGGTKLFVVNSSQVAKQVHEIHGTPENLFRVIHTAVDTEKYRPAADHETLKARICEKMKSRASRPAFLFVSLSHRRKGLDALLDAWKDIDADLWIVGEPLDIHYRSRLVANALLGRVFSLDAKSDITLLYQTADWFIHPTLYDACANTVLQSMASGLPGLISVQDGAIDFIRDGENGLLLREPQNPEAIAAVIRQAMAMTEPEREAMGHAARKTVLPLTWQSHLEKWFEVIQELPH